MTVVPFDAVVPPGANDSVVWISPYVGCASTVEMTPVRLAVEEVGHTPCPSPWMCWTCGNGLPVKVAARPCTCSVTVAVLPVSTSFSVPEALVRPFSGTGFKVAMYVEPFLFWVI
ncbi:MAG: hypothetical protein ACRDXC_11260 [Acidimicrobiales bacterium]